MCDTSSPVLQALRYQGLFKRSCVNDSSQRGRISDRTKMAVASVSTMAVKGERERNHPLTSHHCRMHL